MMAQIVICPANKTVQELRQLNQSGASTLPLAGLSFLTPPLQGRDKGGLSCLLSHQSMTLLTSLSLTYLPLGEKEVLVILPCSFTSSAAWFPLSVGLSFDKHPCLCHSSLSLQRASRPTGSLCI